jgi:hypothetical protein
MKRKIMEKFRIKSGYLTVSCLLAILLFTSTGLQAQVSTVEYGRNRVQHKKFKWQCYQTKNFNIYFTEKTKYLVPGNNNGVTDEVRSDNGLAIGKYVAQVAEKDLPEIENFAETGLQRRANIIVYNNYEDYRSTNIGQGIDWLTPGGVTKLVNNKVAIYFNSDHNNLRRQVREAIARILVDNQLFGDDLGEIAGNQALLDLPVWLTDGYVNFIAENWSTDLDDQLKSALLAGTYKNFYHFAFEKPKLAGHAFWHFLADNYKKENVPYFLYLTRVYKNLNQASEKICKKKFKKLLQEFMEKESDLYYQDLKKRRNTPRGRLFTMEDITKKDYYKFQANPAKRSQDYAVVEYKKGVYRIYLYENWFEKKLLLRFGAKTNYKEYNSQYPLLAWDPKGTRLAVMYSQEGKVKLFIFDAVKRTKIEKTEFPAFDQVQDMQYMLNYNTLLFSAVKNGQSDVYVYYLDKGKLEQITNDVYDDLDPSYVTFPQKTGIIYSSNRPSPESLSNDTILPNGRYNVYIVDDWNKSEFKRLSRLTDLKFGDARFPTQYNVNHFTFIADEQGVANRYAGFFNATAAGLDTLVYIGDEVLHNPVPREADSLLRAYNKSKPDSISFFRVTDDSSYVFPITNYESSVLESRISGDVDQVSETRREGDFKLLYKLKVDDDKLKKRNVNVRPTEYMKKVMLQDKIARGEATLYKAGQDTTKKPEDIFQTGFDNDTTQVAGTIIDNGDPTEPPYALSKAKRFPYQLKFSADYFVSGFNNAVLINKFQPYKGGIGPVQLSGGTPLDGMLRVGTSDLMEDIKFSGGYRLATDFEDNDWLFQFHYLKKRVDWGLTYYRTTQKDYYPSPPYLVNKLYSNLYQGYISYPFDEIKAIKANIGYRNDRIVTKAYYYEDPFLDSISLTIPDTTSKYMLGRIEFVYDNTLNPAQNIWKGLRYKIYMDVNSNISKNVDGKFTYNLGFDGRHYLPLYRHITWATRAAADFSWGTQKLIYYLGGIDNWLILNGAGNPDKYFITSNRPANDQTYAFQSLAVNMRGFKQNVANGNNAMVINSEIRVPIISTFFSRPINNAFLRNFQVVQFLDLGTAWNGKYNKLKRPTTNYSEDGNPLTVKIKLGGIGPFVGGYGFGVRSVLLGYFLRFDAAWQMNAFFRGKPQYYFGIGLDF